MEIEEIISNVLGKLGQTSVSERTIREFVSTIHVADSAEPDDAYFDTIVKLCKTADGNISNVASKAVADYKLLHPEKTVDPPTQPVTPEQSEELKALEARIKSMEEAAKSRENEAKVNKIRNRILSKKDEIGVPSNFEEAWNLTIERINITAEDNEEELFKTAKEEYGKLVRKLYGDGVQPMSRTPQQQQRTQDELKARRDAFAEKMRRKGKLPEQKS